LTGAGWRRIEDRVFASRRVALYAVGLLLCYAIFLAAGYFRQLWLIDPQGQGRPIDFVAAWAAARLAVSGQAAAAYDLAAFTQEQLRAVASVVGDYPWAYPPTYFLLLAPMAALSYTTAALVWGAVTLALYGVGIGAIRPRSSAVLAAAASPFALWCFYAGQNGFLTAALLAGTLALLDRRPVWAGILLGLLTVKPQLGLIFPVVLIVTGRWRVASVAAVTASGLALLSYVLFGMESWIGFFHALVDQAGFVLSRGQVAFHKQQTLHALVRLTGGGDALGWSLQAGIALAALGFAIWLWRKGVDDRLQAAALVMTALLAAPYLFIYDLPILSVAIAFLASLGAERGFVPGERTVIAILMVALLFCAGQPVGAPLTLALWLLIALRLRLERAAQRR
jgi:hypothetical protein